MSKICFVPQIDVYIVQMKKCMVKGNQIIIFTENISPRVKIKEKYNVFFFLIYINYVVSGQVAIV